MKLGVDIRWMVGNYRGMGRFARQLITPISSSVLGLAPQGLSTQEWSCFSQGKNFFPWWEQVELPRLCRSQKIDYLLCPYNTGPLASIGSTHIIAVIHDLIFQQPWSKLPPSISIYQNLGRFYRCQIVPKFIQKVDVILTVSHFTKKELVRKFNLSENNIHVIPNAVADNWFAPPLPLESRQQYLFTVAGEPPSKNIHRLLKAFALASPSLNKEARLKIAGIKSDYHASFMRLANRLEIADQVDLLGYISEEDIRQYYRKARVFILASLFEGFGIPLIEAMASGTPVACSNTTSMPEVVDDCGVLFDPYSVEDIAQKIQQVWQDEKKDNIRRVKSGIDRAHRFSESVVGQTIQEFWGKLI